jgi:hypothetical protein
VVLRRSAEIYKKIGDLTKAVETFEKLIEVNNTLNQQEKEAKIFQSENKLSQRTRRRN